MVKIKVLLSRNKYYKDNPMLKKEDFSVEDVVEIETHLKRTKHPLLVKFKKEFVPKEVATPWTAARRINLDKAMNCEYYDAAF